MHELRFIGIDEDALIVTADSGEQFRILLDDALRDAVRPKAKPRTEAPKVPPREIQQLIRAGRTPEEVVEQTGADPDDVARFEGPVRAERDHIVTRARAVAVHVRPDHDLLDQDEATFGSALDERLESLDATDVQWDSWKDPEHGWRVSLEFRVDEIDRDALWSFDPKSQALGPLNPSAVTLSQQGELSSLQAPRLRVVESDDAPSDAPPAPFARGDEPRGAGWLGPAVADIGSPDRAQRDETADLLEALRRRRGERDPQRFAVFDDEFEDGDEPDEELSGPTTPVAPLRRVVPEPVVEDDVADDDEDMVDDDAPDGSADAGVQAVNVPLPGFETERESKPAARQATGPLGRKRGRAAMPSWDEIVFGTRSDDDR